MSFYNTKEYDLAVTIRCQGYGIHDGVRDSISSMPCGSSMTWLEISSIIINEIEKNASNWTTPSAVHSTMLLKYPNSTIHRLSVV